MDAALTKKGSGVLGQVIKGLLVALSISLVGILVFALIIRFTGIDNNFIMPINQVIKVISIFFGACISVRRDKTRGLYKGLLIGFIYTIFSFLLFSALSGSISFSVTILNDLLFGSIIGALSGIICANIRKR